MASKTNIINVIDLEATCWENGNYPTDGQKQEIIEIGLVEVDTEAREILGKYSYLIKPILSEVSDFCTELTTLTADQLNAEGMTFAEACEILLDKHQSKRRVWASWGDWDRSKFRGDCQHKGVKYPFGKAHQNVKTLHGMKRGLTNPKGLGKACETEGIEFEGTAHRGDDDAYNIAKVLLKVLGDKESFKYG